ncbi:MAG: hypothetical protein K0R29_1032 [Pseudobdellovibrio sp.]|jgi:hypothetical protein|nr:hypothetical protein [Pseudobdellovibrio sp.]
MISRKLKIFWGCAAAAVLTLAFQNCGNIKVANPVEVMASNAKTGIGYFCVPSGYTLETFFITNLNVKSSKYGLAIDTDGDGLSDAEEDSAGYDKMKRRSADKVLDSICEDLNYGVDCEKFTLSCDPAQSEFGINECDKMALNVTMNIQTGAGIDSDKDGIPDILEVRINSFPNLSDSTNDLDFDLANNITEAELGSSSRLSNKEIDPRNLVQITKTKLTSSPSCPSGEYWQFTVENLPTVPVNAFLDDQLSAFSFSHAENENVVQTFVKIKPVSSTSANAKTFSSVQLVTYDRNDVDKSFIFDQAQLVPSGEVGQ